MVEKLTFSFQKSLFDDVYDIGIDYAEIGIDSLLDYITKNEIVKEIPIVKTVYSLGKVFYDIHTRNAIKQTLIFIKEFNSCSIDRDKYVSYKSIIENNPKKAEEELGRVLLLLDGYMDVKKSKILARLFIAYVNGLIDWDKFCEYSEVTNRIFIKDIETLMKMKSHKHTNLYMNYSTGRLTHTGLVVTGFELDAESGNLLQKWEISNIGEKYLQIINNNSCKKLGENNGREQA